MKMKQDMFLAEFFDKTTTVEVNARELQKLLQDKAKLERKLKATTDKLIVANALLRAREDKIKVSLDVKC